MKYLFAILYFTATTGAHAAEPAKYLIETRFKIEGKKIRPVKTSVVDGEKAVAARCERNGRIASIKLSGRKADREETCGKHGEMLQAVEMTARQESASKTGKLRIDLKFLGPKVGTSRQKVIAMPGEKTSLMYYNNKGQLVEATVVAKQL